MVLAPHTDDEFGCAGTIHKFLQRGADVHYVALSDCQASVPAGFALDALSQECKNCLMALGLKPSQIEIWNFPVRHFPAHRQEILERFVSLNKTYKPSLVLLPSSHDTHQDHLTVQAEGFRAFKGASILGYELPQNLVSFENSAFVCLSEENLQAKVRALSEYKSQFFRPYATENFIKSLTHVRGVQAGVQWAEAFELIRLIVK